MWGKRGDRDKDGQEMEEKIKEGEEREEREEEEGKEDVQEREEQPRPRSKKPYYYLVPSRFWQPGDRPGGAWGCLNKLLDSCPLPVRKNRIITQYIILTIVSIY